MRLLTPLLAALLTLAALLLAPGCMAKHAPYPEAYSGGIAMEEADYDEPMIQFGRDERSSTRSAGSGAPAPRRPSPQPSAADGAPPAEPEPDAAPAKRMVFYNGYARMRATRPEDLIAEVVALAEAEGGYVERRSQHDVTVRVPVERFLDFYAATLKLDEVVEKSLSAQDITEAYAAVDLRLRTARATRERLQELLALAETEEEKLQLLREIRRLTEEIDVAEAQLRTLASLASTSRMTVVAVPRDAFSSGQPEFTVAGMDWVNRLNPFTDAVTWEGRHLPLTVPEGFVALDIKRHFQAESADGATMHAARLPNEPVGSTAFWVETIQEALGPEFASAEVGQVGEYGTVRLVQPGSDAPYSWLIAVRVDGRFIELVEVYYPSPEHEARYKAAVEAALSAGGASS